VDHILFDCKLLDHDRARLKAAMLWSENWPVGKNKLSIKFYKSFKEFTNNILFDKL
jgi:chitinase